MHERCSLRQLLRLVSSKGALRVSAAVAAAGTLGVPLLVRADTSAAPAYVLEVPEIKPKLLAGVRPKYPPEYAEHEVEGEVTVDFVVCPDGSVRDPKVVKAADPRLAEFAVAAVLRWVFLPGERLGRPVYCKVRVPVVFEGDAKAKPAVDPAKEALEAALSKGRASLEAKDGLAAAAAFSQAIALSPDGASGYLGRARAYADLGRVDEALDDYQQAALLDPANQGECDGFKKSLPNTPERVWQAQRYQTFNLVWRTVYETYFDPKFGGVDWLAVREKYRVKLVQVPDKNALGEFLERMLGELKRTHFAIVPREAAVFNPSERSRIGTVGAEVAFVEGGVVVTEVRKGSAAQLAGIAPGDRITRLADVAIDEELAALRKSGMVESRAELYVTGFVESWFSAGVGTKVALEVESAPGQKPRKVDLVCAATDLPWSEPIGDFPSSPIRCETSRDADGIARLRFNVFVPPVMKEVKALLKSLKPGDGLIIDLRGNGGGVSIMAAGIGGRICKDAYVMGSMHQRSGDSELEVYPQKSVFSGPVAVLIDGQSASTSEILAAGLKDHHRARVFGVRSAGAALPSFFKSLPTGDLFQYAVADITTPSGALLEGSGVDPDETVLRTRADLKAGKDAVLEAARAWILKERAAAQKGT